MIAGCSSSSDPAPTGRTVSDSSGASIIGAASAAVGSADIGSSGSALVVKNQSNFDPLCSENGDPWDTNTNAPMDANDQEYANRVFYCLVTSNTLESVDTLPGFLRMQESVFCALEAHFGITLSDFTTGGNELVTSAPEAMTLTTSCFPQGLPDGMTSVNLTSAVLTALDPATTGYEYEIALNGDVQTILRYFNENGVIGFQTTSDGEAEGAGEDSRVTVDTNTGVVLLSVIQDRAGGGGADSVYRNLIRGRIKGNFNTSTYQFTSITEGDAYYFISGPMDDGDDEEFAYSVYTVKGNSTTGFAFKHFSTANSNTTDPTVVAANTLCSDGDETCPDSDFDTSAMNAVFKRPAGVKTAWSNYKNSGLPMCEPTSNGRASITVSNVPTSTGALGVCN